MESRGDGASSHEERESRSYLRPYADATRRHGPRFEATLWQNQQKQSDRFRVISEMVDLTGKRVLDAGAGLGDFAEWMRRHRVRYKAYVGIEGVAELAQRASDRGLKRAAMCVEDFAHDEGAFGERAWPGDAGSVAPARPDVIVFSGSLNTFRWPDPLPVLERAWEGCGVAVAFNFLNSRHRPGVNDPGSGHPAWRFDPLLLMDWAMERTSRVRYRQDYFDGHDATIVMERW